MFVDIENAYTDVTEETEGKTLPEKLEILAETADYVKKNEEKVLGKILALTKMLQPMNKKLSKRLSHHKHYVKETEVTVEASNGGKTWHDCLNSIDSVKTSHGVEFTTDDFVRVAEFCDHLSRNNHEFFMIRDLLIYLNRPRRQAQGITQLLTDHLPIVNVKKGRFSILVDAHLFVIKPDKIVDLMKIQNWKIAKDTANEPEDHEEMELGSQ